MVRIALLIFLVLAVLLVLRVLRVFAAAYPQEVCGLVLVDPSRVEHWETFDAVQAWYASNRPGDWPRIVAACRLVPVARMHPLMM